MLWPFVYVHPSQANSNSSRGDNNNFMPIFVKLDSSLDDERQNREQRLMGLLVDNRARTYRY